MFDFLKRFATPAQLREAGVLGMNRRNYEIIAKSNDRRLYPLVDDKVQTKKLAAGVGINTPHLIGVIDVQNEVDNFLSLVEGYNEFVIKPAHGSGGKGVLVGAGAALATEPIACLVLLVIFLVEVAITHIVSLGSIIIAALYPVLTLCYWLWKGTDAASLVFITVCCVLMGAYVIWLHRSNIQRLKNGTEYRFGEKKKENQ